MPSKNLDKALVFEKPGILSENLKTLTNSSYPTVQYFFAETSHTFSTYHCLKKVCGIFLFYLHLGLCAKNKKDLVSTYLFFTLL